jgi:hypothetical protein
MLQTGNSTFKIPRSGSKGLLFQVQGLKLVSAFSNKFLRFYKFAIRKVPNFKASVFRLLSSVFALGTLFPNFQIDSFSNLLEFIVLKKMAVAFPSERRYLICLAKPRGRVFINIVYPGRLRLPADCPGLKLAVLTGRKNR